ncbi:MAG: YiiX/YebB-like N1pC/P60 family cysteine hydrolase [Bdellovibrionales bacterium]
MKNWIHLVIFVTLMATLALAQPKQEKRDLLQDIEIAEAAILNAKDQPEKLKPLFAEYYRFLFELDSRVYDQNSIKKNATRIAVKLQTLRKILNKELKKWPKEITDDLKFRESLQAITRASHYAEDMVAEISLGLEKSKKGDRSWPSFQGGMPFSFTADNRPLLYKDFKSGDILLMRGGSSVSAAIARVTDFNSVFSHAAVVYVDESTGKKYVVEALIEIGITINPLEQALDHGVARMLALRHKDEVMAKVGAEALYQLAQISLQTKKPIFYDFTMSGKIPDLSFEQMMSYYKGNRDPKVVNEMQSFKAFCSLLIDMADRFAHEKLGLPQRLEDPTLRSSLDPKNRNFLRRLGISDAQKSVYAPGDGQMDSRYDIIGDSRNPFRTAGLRADDYILDKIFEWMDRDALEFKEVKILEAVGKFANSTSRIGFMRKLYHSQGLAVAPHVPPKVISTVIMLDYMRNQIHKQIQPLLLAFETQFGVPMPPKQIFIEIEKVYESHPEVLKYLIKPSAAQMQCRKSASKN